MKHKEFVVILDKSGNEKIRVRISTEKGILIDVLFQYESLINKKWLPIVRYDCHHGFFHKDILLANGDKEKIEIVVDSLKAASIYAVQDLKDRWEWYKERYLKKLKTKEK